MKRLVVVAFVAAGLVLGSVALGAGVLSGTYETKVRSNAFDGALKGPWTIKFQRGAYTFTDKARAKASVIRGRYSVSGNKITFMDTSGTCSGRRGPSCPVGCPHTGTYEFKLKGNALTFTVLSDQNRGCVARQAVLTGGFIKVG